MKRKYKIILAGFLLILAGAAAGFLFSKNKPKSSNLINTKGTHYSYFSRPEFFDQVFESANKISVSEPVKAVIVNHHLLGARLIAQTMEAAATNSDITVLLLSPNHFSAGQGDLITSAFSWQTPYGSLEPDASVIQKLKNQGIATVEEQPFESEFGVSGLVAFIRHSMPNAKIVPVIINDRLPLAKTQNLASQIEKALPKNSLIISTIDFSHYLTHSAANFHDELSLSVIKNFNFSSINRLDLDTKPGLALLLHIMQDENLKFNLIEQSNSAKEAGNENILETTSYITGYFSERGQTEKKPMTFLTYGDYGTGLKDALDDKIPNFGFKFMQRLFVGQDYTVGLTQDSLIKAKLTQFGYNILKTTAECEIKDLNGFKLGVCKDSGNKKDLSHSLIDSGANTVVFLGSDKIEPIEIYNNKPIFYGLGDKISSASLKYNQSLALGFVTSSNGVKVYLLPIGADNGQLKLLLQPSSGIVLKALANQNSDQIFKKQIEQGMLIIK